LTALNSIVSAWWRHAPRPQSSLTLHRCRSEWVSITLNVIEDMSLRDGYRYEQYMTAAISKTEDAREAQLAFKEKRQPAFRGRQLNLVFEVRATRYRCIRVKRGSHAPLLAIRSAGWTTGGPSSSSGTVAKISFAASPFVWASRPCAPAKRSTRNTESGSAFDRSTSQSGVSDSFWTCGRAAAISRATSPPCPPLP
jgi:hypothetical protein